MAGTARPTASAGSLGILRSSLQANLEAVFLEEQMGQRSNIRGGKHLVLASFFSFNLDGILPYTTRLVKIAMGAIVSPGIWALPAQSLIGGGTGNSRHVVSTSGGFPKVAQPVNHSLYLTPHPES